MTGDFIGARGVQSLEHRRTAASDGLGASKSKAFFRVVLSPCLFKPVPILVTKHTYIPRVKDRVRCDSSSPSLLL